MSYIYKLLFNYFFFSEKRLIYFPTKIIIHFISVHYKLPIYTKAANLIIKINLNAN